MINLLAINFCESSGILQVVYIVKTIILAVCTFVPIILIVSLMFTLVRGIMDASDKTSSEITSSIVKKSVSAVIVFLVPTFIGILCNIIGFNNQYTTCYSNANIEYISQRKSAEAAEKQLEIEKLKQEMQRRKEELAKEAEIKRQKLNDILVSIGNGSSDSSSYVDGSTIDSSNITYIDTTNLGCTLYYSDHHTIYRRLGFNSQISTQIHSILSNVCTYVKSTPIITNLETAGAYVPKAGYHGRGLAVDLNNLWSVTVNGKTYTPYSGYGPNEWYNYNKFICEACNGKEDCKYNVNYIIYKKYFQGNGWCWGGNWGAQYYDPMHFELTNGGCSTVNKKSFSC